MQNRTRPHRDAPEMSTPLVSKYVDFQCKSYEVQHWQRSVPSAQKYPQCSAFRSSPLPVLSVGKSSTFGTTLRSSMSLLSCWPIKIEEGAGLTISTLSTMVEDKLMLAVTDNPVIYDLSVKSYHDLYKKSRAWRDVAMSVSPSCFLAWCMSSTQTLLFKGISSLPVPGRNFFPWFLIEICQICYCLRSQQRNAEALEGGTKCFRINLWKWGCGHLVDTGPDGELLQSWSVAPGPQVWLSGQSTDGNSRSCRLFFHWTRVTLSTESQIMCYLLIA